MNVSVAVLPAASSASEELRFLAGVGQIVVTHGRYCFRRAVDLCFAHAAGPDQIGILRKFDEIRHRRTFGFAAEARHAARYVGLKPDPGLLAVVDNVASGVELSAHDTRDVRRGGFRKGAFVDVLPCSCFSEQVGQSRTARQAAGMGGQDAVSAELHSRNPLPRLPCDAAYCASGRYENAACNAYRDSRPAPLPG